MTYYCSECGRQLEYGSSRVYTDDEGNLFCDSDCAEEYHGIDIVDWEDFEEDDLKTLDTRENFYGAHIVKNGIITNGHYAIFGVDTPNEFDDGYYKGNIIADVKRMERDYESCEKRLVDISTCARREQRGVKLVDLPGITVQERYLDLIVELLGLPNKILVAYGDDTVSFKTDDGKFAITTSWVD